MQGLCMQTVAYKLTAQYKEHQKIIDFELRRPTPKNK